MTMAIRSTKPVPSSAWEPEPLHLPLDVPRPPPEPETEDSARDDDDSAPGGRVIVLDIS